MSTLTQPSPPPPPDYRTPLAVRRLLAAIAGVGALLTVAAVTFSLLDHAARHTTTERASYTGIRALQVDRADDIRVTGGPAGSPVRVETRLTEGLRSPAHRAERLDGGVLRLSSSCGVVFGGECRVRYEVTIPAGTRVDLDSNTGDITIVDLESEQPIALSSDAGDVTATDVSAPALRLHSSAGDVVARGLRVAEVHADSSAGDVRVALLEPPTLLDADSSAGDVELLVPDAVYALEANSSAGDVATSEVRADPGSPRTIRARSSAGDVGVDVRR